jgi:hypothetical protein
VIGQVKQKAPEGAFCCLQRSKSSCNGLIHKRLQLRFAECPDFRSSELAFVEDHQGGDAADAKFAGDVAVVIDVELGDLQLAVVGSGQLIQRGGDHFAGAAPFGPKVHEDGLVSLQHVGFEAGIGDVFDEVAGHGSSLLKLGLDMSADTDSYYSVGIVTETKFYLLATLGRRWL